MITRLKNERRAFTRRVRVVEEEKNDLRNQVTLYEDEERIEWPAWKIEALKLGTQLQAERASIARTQRMRAYLDRKAREEDSGVGSSPS